eukprot:CAMPEP_0119329508 /NCGR_PEP_ID=MMETSP1333-20130426/76035_1 /TAXON_ID=418940 /ORGANISM="Scyphosphaera apsteinii, Strain RCC1455" /LENGTH=205 /DNA_ID=CAMNT_0007338651 /DNA_START=80 /DNA_END=697 /DNA_ORIENTATION=-
MKLVLTILLFALGAAVVLPHGRGVPHLGHKTTHKTTAVAASTGHATIGHADFRGEWSMDLAASDSLGPLLRELGLNFILRAIVERLQVEQSVEQDESAVWITVRTALSNEKLELRFNSTITHLPGLTGGRTDAITTWLDDERLETRQLLKPQARSDGAPDFTSDVFITVRSVQDEGQSLWEDVSVVRGGASLPVAKARRILRRVS